MGEIMPFYKRENDELLVAPNFVRGPGFELRAESHADHIYPVGGWYWFDTLDDAAYAALGAKPPQPVTDGGQPPNPI